MSQEERPQSKEKVVRASVIGNATHRMSINRFDTRLVDIDRLAPDQLFELACYVLTKPITMRTEKDILVLLKCTSEVKFFQDLANDNGPELHRQCCQRLDYLFQKEGEIVFNLGEVGKTFYIILKGSVGVWVNLPKPAEPGKPVEMVLTEVRVLPSGAAFGELALMSNKPRSATIIAKEDTHFACLDKPSFDRILKETEERKLKEQLDFFREMKLFSGWTQNLLQKVLLQCTIVTFRRNQKIYSQGEAPKEVYFIKSGEVKVSKVIELPTRPKSPTEDDDDLDSQRKLYKFSNLPNSRTVDFAILSAYEHFGEEDIVFDQKRQSNVRCHSQTAEIYVLSKKDFFRRVYNDESARTFLKSHWKWKNQLYAKRIAEILGTTESNKELLLQYKPGMILNLLDLVKLGPDQVEEKPQKLESVETPQEHNTKREHERQRIGTSKPKLREEEDSLYAGFNNFGSSPHEQNKPTPEMEQRLALLRASLAERELIDSAQAERHKKYAVKKVRPRHYGPFVPEGRLRTQVLNFGVPPTLKKISPMVMALQKQRNRDKFMRKDDTGNKISNNTSTALFAVEEAFPAEQKRSSSLDSHFQRYPDRNREQEGDKKAIDPMRTITSLSSRPDNKLNKQEYNFPAGRVQSDRLDTNQGTDKIKDLIMKNLKKMFKREKLPGRTMSDWFHSKRDEFQAKLATENSPERNTFYVGKKAPVEVYVRNSHPFRRLPKHSVKQKQGDELQQAQKEMQKGKERSNTAGDEFDKLNRSTNAFLNSTQTLITQRLSTQIPTESDENSQIDISRQRCVTEERERANSTVSGSFRLTARPFGPVKEFKSKFSLHSLQVQEFKKEIDQVKSFIGFKRLGTD